MIGNVRTVYEVQLASEVPVRQNDEGCVGGGSIFVNLECGPGDVSNDVERRIPAVI